MYPGPGSYGPDDYERNLGGAAVTFPKDPKNTTVEKTNDPGTSSYATYNTVGVIPHYQRNEANARVVELPPKKNDD